ncbi:MAG TPA: penicillin acylase family protein, partial [Vicinamibacterales bacterium]|nr:penicillin acylase family protein [Vicinamibacterales bacterium]
MPTLRIRMLAVILACASLSAHAQTTPAAKAARDKPVAPSETLRLSGLSQPVEVLRDRWGINHIYAKSEHDLFFAQGYNAAKDRLFQFEIWRRQATGTVAAILGRKELKRDIGTRLHMFRGDLKAELNWYHPHGEAIVTAFVDGINAAVEEARRKPNDLPLDFKILGITPEKWTPADVISRHNGLLGNITQEINMAQAVRVMGVDAVKDLSEFYGGDPRLDVDASIDLSLINRNILELYNAFRQPIRFTPDELVAQYRGQPVRAGELDADLGPSAVDLSARQEDIGSNNWVVSGALTQSGYPLLMNDPHRVQEAPSLRYWSHLVAPGWNVIGGGEPMLPGVSIGHNEHGAWGLTIFGTDSEDLYVYDTNPANANQYKYRGAWEDMRIVKDSIAVKGEAAVAVDLKYTRHGPVLYEDKAHHKAYALRAAWMEIGAAPYLASLRMDQAKSWDEFRDACSYSRIPAENMIWADVSGTIGYQAVAITPIRHNFSGMVPVPGDGRYEWDGYLPIKALPHVVNPPKGYWATANNYLFPPGYAYPDAQHHTATAPFRVSRISEILASGRLQTVADMMQLQNDTLSIPARALVPLLRDVPLADPTVAKARALLLEWNDVLDKDSVAAGIYEMWQRRVLANMRDLLVPPEARDVFGSIGTKKTITWMNAPDGHFGADPIAGRNTILVSSLEQAVAELTRKLGPDMSHWQYGQEKYHYALIHHMLSGAVKPEIRAKLDVGPMPRGGDSYTVDATGGTDNQASGGSLKIVADLEDWDGSVALNNPGQSGDPDSPHYRDLFELWSRGKYFPIFYSRPKVESVTEKILMM